MSELPPCPQCECVYTYEDRSLLVCPECSHEWSPESSAGNVGNEPQAIRDSNGQVLEDGDTVVVIKDLKINGSSKVVKSGTKVKGIRLIDGEDGHDIACKVPGHGAMQLKSSVVKKGK